MKITDKQIADVIGRSPQVVHAMKKTRKRQYEVLRIGAIEVLTNKNLLIPYSEMTKEELIKEHERTLQSMIDLVRKLEIISDFIADKISK